MRYRSIVCWASLVLLSACRSARAPSDPPAVCALALPRHLQHTSPDALPVTVWYELLFKGYRGGSERDPYAALEAVDCSGEPIAWAALPSSCVEPETAARLVSPASEAPSRDAESSERLIVRHAGGDYWFGWAPFVRFDNGMSEGPLAIARLHRGKLEVRAIGNLRAYTRRARLEVRQLARQHILVAEGEHCDAEGHCARGTRLMWLDRQHFRPRPLRSATVRSCLGPSWFAHSETLETRIDERWNRVLRRDLALAFEDDRILADEHITVNDRDLEQPALPARLFREAQAQIRITLQDGEFLSEGQSLWSAIRIEDGSTELLAERRRAP